MGQWGYSHENIKKNITDIIIVSFLFFLSFWCPCVVLMSEGSRYWDTVSGHL